jgi:hypothetical protein
VPRITSARRTLTEDVDRRTHRYLVSMSIRTVCLVLAVLVEGPLRWVLLAGAIVLPYVAVVLANAGREPDRAPDALLPPTDAPSEITAGPEGPRDDDRP